MEVLKSLCEAAEAHKNLAKHQQDACAEQARLVRPRRPVCIMDYKAKVILGLSCVQLGHEFYESPMRSLLGFTLFVHPDDFERVRHMLPSLELHGYRVDHEVAPDVNPAPQQAAQAQQDGRGKHRGRVHEPIPRKPWKIHFEFVFDEVSQNGWQTIAGIRALFEHEFVRALDPLGFTFWMDNGSHFKNKELARYFCDFANFDITWNHFAAQHGKNVEDTRFAIIQHFFNTYCNTFDGSMRSSNDIVNVIKAEQLKINKTRVCGGKRPVISFQQVVPVPPIPQTADILQFDDIRALHSFVIDPVTKRLDAFLQTNAETSVDLTFESVTVPRKVKQMIVGHPNPVDPASLEGQTKTLKTVTKAQIQRRKLGDKEFICDSVKNALRPRRPKNRAPPQPPREKRQIIDTDDLEGEDVPASRDKRKVRPANDSDGEYADVDNMEFRRPNKKARVDEPQTFNYATRSKAGAARKIALSAALKTANSAAGKKKLSASDRAAIDGIREVFRSDIRAAGNETATQGDLVETLRRFAAADIRQVVWDYEDDREDVMDVDQEDAMEVDEDFEAVWSQIPSIPYNRGR